MRGRIRNLESLVVSLINQKQQENGADGQDGTEKPAKTDDDKPENDTSDGLNVESFGQLNITNSGTGEYVGAGHWSSLLKEIEDVKDSMDNDDWADETAEDEWNYGNARSTVTYGIPKPVSKATLIQELPPKEEVDHLLPLYFNSADPFLFIIHAPTFLDEYKQFWRDPSSTPVMWIAMLYSIMALSIIVGPRNPGMTQHDSTYSASGAVHDKGDEMIRKVFKYQQMASSAMVLADIAKNQPYTVETLMIYGECEFLRRDDHHSKIWLMNGVTLRVAVRMGYHRDPSKFKGITPFQGEMRRRLWHVLNMMDVLISFAIGLPPMVRRVESDVRAPRNLFDSDISPDMKSLPKERPYTEITPASYCISKSRICVLFAEAAELSQKIIPPKHSHIMAIDKKLEEAYKLIPEGMRVRPLEDCFTDSPVLIMSRYNIELLYQKTRIILHRNFVTAGQADARYAESRKICLDAAMETMRHQNNIFHACQPGGQLTKVWWYMASLNTYDFLLSAMVLCLELNHLQTTEPTSPRIPELLGIVENTHGIWANHPHRFRETVRGAEILSAMLKKCYGEVDSQALSQMANSMEVNPSKYAGILQRSHPNHNKDIAKQPSESTPESIPEQLPPQIWGTQPSPTDGESLEMPDIPSEIDWVSNDHFPQSALC
jgi:hypothetical protein